MNVAIENITEETSGNKYTEQTSPRPCEICKKIKFLTEHQDSKRILKFDLCRVCLGKKK